VCQASDALKRAGVVEVVDRTDWRSVLRARRPPRRTDAATRVVLLGTGGGSYPRATRAGYANAVVVGDAVYMVDCGEGANTQLWRAGLSANAVADRPSLRSVFITHLHADHIMDLVNLFVGSWPRQPIDVFGPAPAGLPIPSYPPAAERPLVFPDEPTPGTKATLAHLLRAFAYNINLRVQDEGRTNVAAAAHAHEIGVTRDGYGPEIDLGCLADGSTPEAAAPLMEPVVVLPEDDRGVTVSTILVQHAPVFPALAYRFDTPHGSVVFSGDTGPCDNVVRLAQGADILVHEVIDVDALAERLHRLPNGDAVRQHLARAHSSPAQVGEIATRAGVKTLVLSHLVPGDLEPSEEEWEEDVRPHFAGEVLCGVDLDELALA
jgi:ribonuclease BN (tRNA processing enzyme)